MESNPQSIIVVQRGSDLHTSFQIHLRNITKYWWNNVPGSVGLKNSKKVSHTNGHTWYINRIGLGKKW
jgi:hypothetical protein